MTTNIHTVFNKMYADTLPEESRYVLLCMFPLPVTKAILKTKSAHS